MSFSTIAIGTYRVVLVGGSPGARGSVRVSALGSQGTFPFITSADGIQTVAETTVTIPN